MEFKLTKASNYIFKKPIDVDTLNELLEMLDFYDDNIIISKNIFYKSTNENCKDELIDLKYEITIYDDYME